MKRFALVSLLFVLALGLANASPMLCAAPPSTTTLATVGGAPTGVTITCDGVVFSNFTITDAGNSPNAFLVDVVDTANPLNGTHWDPTTGLITLNFNPNLNNNAMPQDVHITFNVSSANLILDVGGSAGVVGVQEIVCNGLNNVGMAGNCISGSPLAMLSYPPTTTVPLSPTSSQVSIWKDASHATGTALSGFSQTFLVVPEPATFALLGGGLLLFALARRKKRA